MARKLVVITLILWSPFLLLAIFVGSPFVVFAPLYAFCPGDMSSGSPNYHPIAAHIWASVAGLFFVALAVRAVRRNDDNAAKLFMGLFIISALIITGRTLDVFRQLN